jgi:hypothetical protein
MRRQIFMSTSRHERVSLFASCFGFERREVSPGLVRVCAVAELALPALKFLNGRGDIPLPHLTDRKGHRVGEAQGHCRVLKRSVPVGDQLNCDAGEACAVANSHLCEQLLS